MECALNVAIHLFGWKQIAYATTVFKDQDIALPALRDLNTSISTNYFQYQYSEKDSERAGQGIFGLFSALRDIADMISDAELRASINLGNTFVGVDPEVIRRLQIDGPAVEWGLWLGTTTSNDAVQGRVDDDRPESRYLLGFDQLTLIFIPGQISTQSVDLYVKPAAPGALAQSLYSIHSQQGNGQLDFSSIFNLFSKQEK